MSIIQQGVVGSRATWEQGQYSSYDIDTGRSHRADSRMFKFISLNTVILHVVVKRPRWSSYTKRTV